MSTIKADVKQCDCAGCTTLWVPVIDQPHVCGMCNKDMCPEHRSSLLVHVIGGPSKRSFDIGMVCKPCVGALCHLTEGDMALWQDTLRCSIRAQLGQWDYGKP